MCANEQTADSRQRSSQQTAVTPQPLHPSPFTLHPERGQGTIEYAVLVAAIVAALVAMVTYVKRGVEGGLQNAADSMGAQFHPKQTTSTRLVTVVSDTTTVSTLHPNLTNPLDPTQKVDVMETISTTNRDTTTRTGSETVGPLGSDLWN